MVRSSAAGAILTVDLAALAANYERLRAELAGIACAGVVKADAYGIGLAPAARALAEAGCRAFFVAHQVEAAALRRHLPEAEIFVLHGPMPGEETAFAEARLVPVLNTPHQVAGWLRRARRAPAAVHLDSGLNRLGLGADDLAEVPGLNLRLLMSHLASAEEVGNPSNARQRRRFMTLKARLPAAPASLANSSAIFLGPRYHFDLARGGVALYGGNPTPGRPNPMRDVIHLQGKILALRQIDRGQGVGYGATFRAPGRRLIATVPVGYADGYFRALGNRAFAAIDGYRVPVVGRVSMDLITLDVTEVPGGVAEGALVDLIGGGVGLGEVAGWAGGIEYEVLTALGRRYHRRYRRHAGSSRQTVP
jgi:alanine racemase